jgi:hypothetical protein
MTELVLPLGEAIPIVAYQNLLVDQINDPDPELTDDWNLYLEEARYLLTTSGENYKGIYGHPTIKVKENPQ